MHGLCLLYAPHLNQHLLHPAHLGTSSAKMLFLFFLQISVNFYGLSTTYFLFLSNVQALSSFYQLSTVILSVHKACPCQRQCPFLSVHFVSFPQLGFANISLQASRNLPQRSMGSQHGSLGPDKRCITIIVSFRWHAQMSTEKNTLRNYFCKLFLTFR